jgi:hypothetical protein
MKYGLPDDAVRRIAAAAFHDADMKIKSSLKSVSGIYNSLNDPNTQGKILQAHTTSAMQGRFKTKESENTFKSYLAKSAAINRGTLDPVPAPQG